MLTVTQITKSFGVELVLNQITFTANAGERLALVGANGCGKTTLLRILTGEETPDSGSVRFDPATLEIGYLPQGFVFPANETIGSYINRCEGNLDLLSIRLEWLAAELAHASHQPGLQSEYDRVLARLQLASENNGRGAGVLVNLGLGDYPVETPVENLSGGQKTRLALAGVLVTSPSLLLLDEPTNHLDFEMLEWLEDWLLAFPGGAIYVSHDRAFIDRTATAVMEIDQHTHTLRTFAGNYSAYLETVLAERDRQLQAYSDQQEEISRLRFAATRVRGAAKKRVGGKADGGDKFAKGFFSDQSAGTIARARALERRLDRLMNEDRIEKPRLSWQIPTDFGEPPTSGKDVLVLDDLSVGYGENVLLSGITQTIRQGERVAFVGPNGSGKTTLLRTIAGMIPPLKGSLRLGSNVHMGYMTQEQKELDPNLDALTTIRRVASFHETEARAFLSQFLFPGDEVFTLVGNLSYGERARLSLACFVARGCNFLMLDEPINHLDIPSRSRFEQAMTNFEGTVLAVVHDRFFIDGFASAIWEVKGGTLRWHTVLEQAVRS